MHLFHTSQSHPARFDRVRDRVAPGLPLVHHVHEVWLDRARAEGLTPALTDEITSAIAAATGAKLCTCTTIGPVAEAAGAVRIDRPLMEAAAGVGGRVLLVYCLAGTADASRTLLAECLGNTGQPADIDCLALPHLWPLFEAGDEAGFEATIAEAIRSRLGTGPRPRAVVLAQASMAGAADRLGDVGLPVLSAPDLAFRAALARA
ncbi:MAG: hypothetical protein KDE08_05200 [Rhodobacteraceae bacterium]|nr:hypothetical protein [Paracoccaceae bacterium]